MRDVLEEHLATHLRTLGETVDDELPPPVDLELRVLRRRRRARQTRRWSSVGVAAAIVAVVSVVAVARGTSGRGSIRVATSPTTAAPVHDALQPGTVMLSARGRYVISLDAGGHTNATMVQAHGDITYARATDDHRALWYLSHKLGSKACGDVVRADIEGRTSTIVMHAVAFDVSPDGSRLALYGAGDLAHDHCSPVTAGVQGRIVVFDLASRSSSALTVGSLTSMRWSPDGSYLAVASCPALGCEGLGRIDVAADLGRPLVLSGTDRVFEPNGVRSETLEFGPDGLYALAKGVAASRLGAAATTTSEWVDRYDARTLATPTLAFAGEQNWVVSQIVPTGSATYVVATAVKPAGAKSSAGLYRLRAGRLVFVRSLTDPGTLTPVAPMVISP